MKGKTGGGEKIANEMKGTILAFGTIEAERAEIIKNFPLYELKSFKELN